MFENIGWKHFHGEF